MSTRHQTSCPPVPRRLIRGAYADHFVEGDVEDRRRPSFVSGPSLTDQSYKEECDVNNVILRYAATGELPARLNRRQPEYLDVSDVPDLHTALQRVADANRVLADILADQAEASAPEGDSESENALDSAPDPAAKMNPEAGKGANPPS